MRLIKIFLLLSLPLPSFCQQNCTGVVVDKLTGNKIPYATIGLVKENTGVNADAQGAFSIRSSWSGVDSFRISSVGYETTVLPVHGWTDGQVIRLLPKEGMLKEVIVSANRQKKVYDLNRFGHCSWNWYQIGRETIYQLAQRFEAPGDGMQLLQLELCKDRSESIFRFRIYDVDSVSKGPGKDLADTIIEVSSGETHAEINLEQHHIIIPGKSFFVAVEWIFIPYNEEYQTIKSNGVKRESLFYRPSIRWVNRSAKKGEVWQLHFDGRWSEIHPSGQHYNFQITSKLR